MTNSLHLDAFCQFWEMNFNSPVPPLPQQPSDLSITELEQLRGCCRELAILLLLEDDTWLGWSTQHL